MSMSLVLAFWVMTLALIAVPGPDWAFTLASGIRDRVVLPAVGGLMLGYVVLTGFVAAGVGTLVTQTPPVLDVLTFVGAAYLIYLGWRVLSDPGAAQASPASVPRGGWRGWMLRGMGVSGLNPKGLLLFLAMLPQFTDPRGTWSAPVQLGTLGLPFVATCGLFYTALGLGARAVLGARPAASRVLTRVSGVAMVVVGIALLAERLLTH
ncbi:LysE family translocator [Mumia sp. zg.B53]|uniref:LysE family translocator n=1 Tax=Mumia sp. zg.B53 TaxID=2855449 RepID=UPI001C6E7176|nr:LysE family translocator [Mumia sp. zg.B53]MBW9213220.1 LysE family translocator [Mumia sp. zg.B53]